MQPPVFEVIINFEGRWFVFVADKGSLHFNFNFNINAGEYSYFLLPVRVRLGCSVTLHCTFLTIFTLEFKIDVKIYWCGDV